MSSAQPRAVTYFAVSDVESDEFRVVLVGGVEDDTLASRGLKVDRDEGVGVKLSRQPRELPARVVTVAYGGRGL